MTEVILPLVTPIAIKTATKAWYKTLDTIVINGTEYVGRDGHKVKEVINNTLVFNMLYPVIYHPDRKINYSFSASEALFIANGDNRVSHLTEYNKNIAQFSDDGIIFNGSYGPPFNEQLMYVVNNLVNQPASRQAVLTIWQPNPVESKDIRCTLSFQFLIRNGRINTIVNMRSSDIMWGVCYDLFNFTIMTLRVLTLLNQKRAKSPLSGIPYPIDKHHKPYELGYLYLNMGSSHLYERHYELAEKILSNNYEISNIIEVPEKAFIDWKYVTDSLRICIDKDENRDDFFQYWPIRPIF